MLFISQRDAFGEDLSRDGVSEFPLVYEMEVFCL